MGSAETSRQVRLFLIRHGETVDNVASVYAGHRDSELTSHGYQQAKRLGAYFQSQGIVFSHIFSSQLQRAAKTAAQIRDAQVTQTAAAVIHVPLIVEKHFGSYEGKKWHEGPGSKSIAKEHPTETTGFVDTESRESMAQRADAFLDQHLLPLLEEPAGTGNHVIAVVSHGIILSVLWRRLLSRFPPNAVSFSSGVMADVRGCSLERLGAWSNTGYLELHMRRVAMQVSASRPSLSSTSSPSVTVNDFAKTKTVIQDDVPRSSHIAASPSTNAAPSPRSDLSNQRLLHAWLATIEVINGRAHLKNLKRTGGGVGSARHDASQQNIDRFFKRRKLE